MLLHLGGVGLLHGDGRRRGFRNSFFKPVLVFLLVIQVEAKRRIRHVPRLVRIVTQYLIRPRNENLALLILIRRQGRQWVHRTLGDITWLLGLAGRELQHLITLLLCLFQLLLGRFVRVVLVDVDNLLRYCYFPVVHVVGDSCSHVWVDAYRKVAAACLVWLAPVVSLLFTRNCWSRASG